MTAATGPVSGNAGGYVPVCVCNARGRVGNVGKGPW